MIGMLTRVNAGMMLLLLAVLLVGCRNTPTDEEAVTEDTVEETTTTTTEPVSVQAVLPDRDPIPVGVPGADFLAGRAAEVSLNYEQELIQLEDAEWELMILMMDAQEWAFTVEYDPSVMLWALRDVLLGLWLDDGGERRKTGVANALAEAAALQDAAERALPPVLEIFANETETCEWRVWWTGNADEYQVSARGLYNDDTGRYVWEYSQDWAADIYQAVGPLYGEDGSVPDKITIVVEGRREGSQGGLIQEQELVVSELCRS